VIDLWTAMAGTTDGDHLDPNSDIPIGEAYRLAAEWLADTLAEISGYYPLDVWPAITPEQMKALHEFAETQFGMADGSRYHVGGIRHAIALVRGAASQVVGGADD